MSCYDWLNITGSWHRDRRFCISRKWDGSAVASWLLYVGCRGTAECWGFLFAWLWISCCIFPPILSILFFLFWLWELHLLLIWLSFSGWIPRSTIVAIASEALACCRIQALPLSVLGRILLVSLMASLGISERWWGVAGWTVIGCTTSELCWMYRTLHLISCLYYRVLNNTWHFLCCCCPLLQL